MDQPLLPSREEPKTLRYHPTGSDEDPEWLVGDWRAAAAAFSIEAHQVVDWHVALAGQGRPWLIIRRIFSIAPLWGSSLTPDDMKSWSWSELGKSLGLSEPVLRKDLEAAVAFWKKVRVSLAVQRTAQASAAPVNLLDAAPPSPDPAPAQSPPAPLSGSLPPSSAPDSLPDFQIHQSFDAAQITAILTPFRFNHLRAVDDRLYVANRILELRKLLEDKFKRESARQLILMEMNMANYESTIAALKSRLVSIHKSSDVSKEQSKEIQDIADSIEKQEKALTKLADTYHKAANEIGGDEMEAGEARHLAIGTAAHLVEAHRRYYETGERVLIDGMFTADEIVWLTTPLSIRPAQYRLDIVLRVREACLPENLWDKEYKPSVVQRDACRRLAKIVDSLTDEAEPQVIEGIDDLPAQSATDEDDPSDASDSVMPGPASFAPQEYTTPDSPRPGGDEPCMGVG
jgi:hypothetical protein